LSRATERAIECGAGKAEAAMRLSTRAKELPPYVFARAGDKLRQLVSQGVDVINLGVGSPDLPPPAAVVETLCQAAMRHDSHGYCGYYGLPALRRAIADYYHQRFEVRLDPDTEVVVLIGSKEGLVNVSLAYLDQGDVSLIPDPGYPTYNAGTYLAGGVRHALPLREEQGYRPDLASIPADISRSAKILWLNYPNNPTGATSDLEFLEGAVAYAQKHNVLLCFDNPYCEVTFDGYRAPSVLQVPGAKQVSVEFNSLSKTYNMAGWRVGMAVGNGDAVKVLKRVKTNVDSGLFRPIQEAAIAAITCDRAWIEERNAVYQRRRDVVMQSLAKCGLSAASPKATLYIWARLPEGEGSWNYAMRVLDSTGVWVTPGSAFGAGGEGYVRISLTTPEHRLREALDRWERFAQKK